MPIAEHLLYGLARCLYRTQVAQSPQMKQALANRGRYNAFRRGQLDTILAAASRYGVEIGGRDVLDLGCNDGAITPGYLERGARRVVGVDINAKAIERANANSDSPQVSFHAGTTTTIPLPDRSIDTVICHDVFEHVSKPAVMLDECHRIMRPGGRMLIGTWGWRHPFAPHLWATMPVPWAHVVVSERTLLRACRRVYRAPWYRPTMHDLDEAGARKDKYNETEISCDYLNKLLIRDFERVFEASSFEVAIHPQPFGSRWARWTRIFLRTPWIREFITAYIWVVLTKDAGATGN